jgi:hypothetical protein
VSGLRFLPTISPILITTSTAHRERSEAVFTDTLYLAAVVHPHDQYRDEAIRTSNLFAILRSRKVKSLSRIGRQGH